MKRKIFATITTLLLFFAVFTPAVQAKSCDLYKPPAVEVLVPWYKYLPGDDVSGKCRVSFPSKTETISGKKHSGTDVGKTVSLIAIAIIELLTKVSGLIAVGFIIWGGIQYIVSQGEPEGTGNAKNTITNALIGFVIVVLAIAIVQFIGRALTL